MSAEYSESPLSRLREMYSLRTGGAKRVPVGAANHLTKSGAESLAAHIVEYWRERGGEVSVQLVPDRRCPEGRLDIRSDMRNGWPSVKL